MPDLRMVPLVRVSHGFEARVVAAKLGSEGIVTQFRGAVEGPYPVGSVEVLVARDDIDEARQILDAEEIGGEEIGGGADPAADGTGRSRTPALLLLVLALVLVALAMATALGSGFGR